MFWKSFLIGLIIDADSFINCYRVYKSYNNNRNLATRAHLSNGVKLDQYSKFFNTTYYSANLGHDERFPYNEPRNEEIILNITKFNSQMKLLTFLEDKTISQHEKIKKIDEYNRDNSPSIYLGNIKGGNLFKDWES